MPRLRTAVLLLAACTLPLGAQSLGDATAIAGPQWVQYKFSAGGTEKTVSQLAVPIALIVPFNDRLNLDISTSYAMSEVHFNGAKTSSISGLTDTLVRGSMTLTRDVVSLLPHRLAFKFAAVERYGFFILLALLFTGILGTLLSPFVSVTLYFVAMVCGIPAGGML